MSTRQSNHDTRGRQEEPGTVVWLTGLPASGKTTVARALAKALDDRGDGPVHVLDSDELRPVLTPEPRFTEAERDWFYEVVGYIAELLYSNGVLVLVSATAPLRRHRDRARARVRRFVEVLVSAPEDICRARDPKGLWARSDRGEIPTLPGAGAPYEPPTSPEIRIDTTEQTPEEAAREILGGMEDQGFLS